MQTKKYSSKRGHTGNAVNLTVNPILAESYGLIQKIGLIALTLFFKNRMQKARILT